MNVPILRALFGQSNDTIEQSDIVMLLTPRVIRTHELTAEDLAPIFIGTQQNVGLGGPPPLIAPPAAADPAAAVPPGTTPPPDTGVATAPTRPGEQLPPVAAPPGAQTSNPPLPPGGAARPGIQPPPAGTVPPVTPPGGVPPTDPTVPRDPTAPLPAGPPGAAPATATPAQVIITTAGTEFRIAGGPYLAPVAINNAQRVSTMSLTVTFNPQVVRVRNVQEGTFMRQGSTTVSFTPKIDAVQGRVDITIARVGDQVGATGAGLIASLLFDAVAPGSSMIQVSGIAAAPDGTPLPIQFSPITVTVR